MEVRDLSPEDKSSLMDLDNTKRGAFVACPRKYYWGHVLHLRPKRGSTALRYGLTWHAMLETFYNQVAAKGWNNPITYLPETIKAGRATWLKESSGEQQFEGDYRTLEAAEAAFMQYLDYFSGDPGIVKIIDTERIFEILVAEEGVKVGGINVNPFLFTGKLDMRVQLNSANWIVENKTTGAYLTMAISRLNRSPQMLGYTWASNRLGDDVQGMMIVIHHLSARKNKAGDYGATKIDFQRVPQLYTQTDLDDWLNALYYTAGRIQAAMEANEWPACHDNCYQFGACPYTSLCEQPSISKGLEYVYIGDFVAKKWDVRQSVSDD